jgi:AcrR family transcriptional regulator
MEEVGNHRGAKENNRQKRTREKVINLAMQVLAKNPKASLNEIAEAAEVGRATLFRYFKSRKQLIHELVVEADRKLERATRPRGSSVPERPWRSLLRSSSPWGQVFIF